MPDAFPGDLARIVDHAVPGAQLVRVTALGPDAGGAGETAKSVGYGAPLKLIVKTTGGEIRTLVFHTATPNVFGHDRRADRAGEMLLAYDTFGAIPNHVPALDVGAIAEDRRGLVSLRGTAEFYLLTEWAEGHVYADELRAVRERGSLTALDLEHCRTLAHYLADLHRHPLERPTAYVRAIRDLLGSGQGIFGIIDGYPQHVAAAPASRLHAIEKQCLAWRWRLKGRTERLRRIHGDFHPFNILFDEHSRLKLLDTSRGSLGDPADDVACLAINYLFFALDQPSAWSGAFKQLWYEFWARYRDVTRDVELGRVLAPFLAWRGLVLANPAWYAAVNERARDRLLCFVESVLAVEEFHPEFAERMFS